MNRTAFIVRVLRKLIAGILCLALPALSWGDIVNTATASYFDSNGLPFTATSNTVITRFELLVPPVITTLTPSVATEGDPALPVTLTGNFPSDAQAIWSDGSLLPATSATPTRMDVMIPGGLLSSPGDFSVQVRSAAMGASNALPFVVAAVPVAVFGSDHYTLSINDTLSLERASGVAFTWAFTTDNVNASLSGPPAPGFGAAVSAKTITRSPQLPLRTLNVGQGTYAATVTAINAAGKISSAAQTTVTLLAPDFSAARVFPNPWRATRGDGLITFDQMPINSQVKIFTVSGRSVKTLPAPGGSVTWDLTNDSGDRVASGLYLYLTVDSQGNKARGKFTVIR